MNLPMEAHSNWQPCPFTTEDTARCIGVFSHLRHFPSCPWVSVYHDLVRMRICYKAIDTSVISCPSTLLCSDDMRIKFWSVVPWAMLEHKIRKEQVKSKETSFSRGEGKQWVGDTLHGGKWATATALAQFRLNLNLMRKAEECERARASFPPSFLPLPF